MHKHSEIVDLLLKDNKLILDPSLVNKLKAEPGDRIEIGYRERDGLLRPIISVGENGNKLTKSNTVSFRGVQHNTLAQFGSNFWVVEIDDLLELEGDGIPVYTDVKKAAQAVVTKEIILDTNYTITKLENYEFQWK